MQQTHALEEKEKNVEAELRNISRGDFRPDVALHVFVKANLPA